jgi:protein-disulfide isomerase
MTLSRRSLLLAPAVMGPVVALTPVVLTSGAARAQGTTPVNADGRLGDRAAGQDSAKVTVLEYFSLTCPHCAAFHKETWPRVKDTLVKDGTVRMVWREFPLDQLALAASQVARTLPAERYEGFVSALFASQDRWAFARGADPIAEIAKIAALAGMSRADFDRAQADDGLKRGILQMRLQAEREHQVNSTPTFVFGSRVVPGEIPFERFAENVRQNSRS